MVYSTKVIDGIDYLASPIVLSAESGVTTLVGATVAAYARNSSSGTSYPANSCVVASATSIRAVWTPGSLPAGRYEVDIVATPLGYAIKTVASIDVVVSASAGPT